MLVPLYLLAFGAVFAGFFFAGPMVGEHWQHFWGSSILVLESHQALEAAHHVPLWVKLSPLVFGLLGILVAWRMYIQRPESATELARTHDALHQFLLNKWYFDELYDLVLVRPAMWVGRVLWKGGDGRIIDGLGPDGVAASVVMLARRIAALQTGYLYHYAFAMLIGVAGLVSIFYSVGH